MRPWNAALAAGLLCLLLGGCASGDPYTVWKTSLESYVEKENYGDMSALRDTRDSMARPEFGVLKAQQQGIPVVSPERTDTHGVLLAHERALDRWWFVYLVGAVKYKDGMSNFPVANASLLGLRLMAVRRGPDGWVWREGPLDAEALRLYRERQLEAWRRSQDDRADRSDGPTTFPTENDAFRCEIDGATVIAVDENSGARWTLSLRDEKTARAE
ncbi:MAG: hypothetical protein ACYTG1_04470 [Planctomycetota bacterium]|jgi:hypothetical protein